MLVILAALRFEPISFSEAEAAEADVFCQGFLQDTFVLYFVALVEVVLLVVGDKTFVIEKAALQRKSAAAQPGVSEGD